jgi:hypothetical protein
LVLSPTGVINLGFTTEGRLAAVLIITFSWGFPTGRLHIQYSYINTAPPPVFSMFRYISKKNAWIVPGFLVGFTWVSTLSKKNSKFKSFSSSMIVL